MSLKSDNQRISFSSVKNRMHYPDFLEVQLKSFQDFFQLDTTAENRKNEGLYKVFMENFPITDTRNNFVLEFIDYYVDPPRYSMDECLERGLTYSVPLKAKLKLYCTDPEHEDFDTVIQDVYFGTIPYMTPRGTFIINGAERVIVSQLHRSPGVFFGQSIHTNGTKLYSARIIPFKGSWIEFATDINNVMYAYIDRKKKLPVTTLLRAIGFESDRQILEIFDLAEDVKVTKTNLKKAVGQKLAARVLNACVDVITLREPDSQKELQSMGVTRPEVLLTADPALTLPAASDDEIDSVLLRAGIPPRGNYLCFALRNWKGFESKASLFGQAAKYAYETYGLTPVFAAVEKHLDPGAGRLAAAGLDIPHYFLDDAGSAGTIIGALSRMQAVVSMRLHALIFAAGQGIPLAGVVYDPKVSSFLRYIGQENFADLDALTPDLLKSMIDRVAAAPISPEEQEAAVRKLRQTEQVNVETARRLLGV